jgi:branched-chain amino acid transport system substrate-binding protein
MFRKLAIAIAALAGLAISGTTVSADTLRIGFSMSKTGMFANATPSQLNVYELWREQVNAAGGLDVAGKRHPIEFVSYDDQSDPGNAVKIYEKLITDDEVDLLLAPWGTPFHFAVAGVLERYKFPMVGNSAASVQLREIKAGYIWFPTSAIPDRIAVELVKLLKSQGVKTVAVTNLQLPFSLEIKQFLMPELEKAGLEVVVSEDYPPGTKDMTAMLTAVKNAAPDAVLSLSYPPDSVLYMNTARELGIDAKFQLALIGPTIDFFGQMFGPAADGIVTVGHWSPHQKAWPRARPFFDAYVARFGSRPDYLDSALAYMSLEILEQAVAIAGLDREKLRDAIANGSFETINGEVRFDGVQNSVTPTMFLQLQDGEAQIIWPPDQSTAAFRPKPAWPAQ